MEVGCTLYCVKKPFAEIATAELYQIIKARIDVFVIEQECPYTELDNCDQQAVHLWLKDDREIAAYARLLPQQTTFPEASIGRVLVANNYRGRGYANEIMQQAIAHLTDEWEETVIKIQAQTYLQMFYASHGFEQISDAYLEDGIPHIDMIWKQK